MSDTTQVSRQLHERARAWIASYEAGTAPTETFDAFSVAVASYQFDANPHFRKLCDKRGVGVAQGFERLPGIPTSAFKHARIACFSPSETTKTFQTSGTTIGDPGSHAFRDVGTYDRGAVAFGRTMLLGGFEKTPKVLTFGLSPALAPASSLTHMCSLFADRLGSIPSTDAFFLDEAGVFDLVRFDACVTSSLMQEEPVLVLGTSFSFVHLLDALGDDKLPLPAGSRVMQTGGFKGKSREVDAGTLRKQIANAFSIPETHVVSEYGMTELSSQFYDEVLPSYPNRRLYRCPPWARVVPVHEDTLLPVPVGEVGIARIEDLLNIDSACILLTEDRVRKVDASLDHFELLGRLPGAAPRGCSIAIDELIGSDDR
ncbi:MAG: acyl-protein synthetase [Polyangiaceae bacterium]